MSTVLAPPPAVPGYDPAYRLSVAAYERMVAKGIIPEDDPVELIEGHLLTKMIDDGTDQGTYPPKYRLSVAAYEQMVAAGIIPEDDQVELIEGILVSKMSRGPLHDGVLQRLDEFFADQRLPGWQVRGQKALTLNDSVPEPDITVVRRIPSGYIVRHPTATDAALVIEVAHSSLGFDRVEKCRAYARAGVPEYWIVNLVDRVIEVYRRPSGPTERPAFAEQHDSRPGDTLAFAIDGRPLSLDVADLLRLPEEPGA